MNSRSQKYSFLLFAVIEVADNELIAVVAGDGLTQYLALHEMFAFGIVFYFPEEVLQARVGVGVGMRYIDCVVVVYIVKGLHGNLTEKVSVW